MIRYALRCADGHDFDAWFRSAEGYDAMRAADEVACAVCGSTSVHKAPMAPAVPTAPRADLRAPASPAEAALAALREHVERNSDYVGDRFVTEARDMHEGRKPGRAIHGEARVDEAMRLAADGIPVAPLPFRPRRKVS